jgi:hypothetical protein
MNWKADPTKTFLFGVAMGLLPFVAVMICVLVML